MSCDGEPGKPPPLLFLLDELLQGTNSHDRLLGAEAVVRALLGTGAIGLLTTHDLALTGLAKATSPEVVAFSILYTRGSFWQSPDRPNVIRQPRHHRWRLPF